MNFYLIHQKEEVEVEAIRYERVVEDAFKVVAEELQEKTPLIIIFEIFERIVSFKISLILINVLYNKRVFIRNNF